MTNTDIDPSVSTLDLLGFGEPLEGDDLGEAAGAFGAMVALVPRRPEIGVALIGALGLAPLRLSQNCPLMLCGPEGSGKSDLLNATLAWLLPSPTTRSSMVDIDLLDQYELEEALRRCKDLPFVAEGPRGRPEFGVDIKAFEAVSVVASSGCNVPSGAWCKPGGTNYPVLFPKTQPIISCEHPPVDKTVLRRLFVLDLVPGDVDVSPGGALETYLDHFVWAPGAPAVNRLYSTYRAWLALQLSSRGPLAPESVDEDASLALYRTSNRRWDAHFRIIGHEYSNHGGLAASLAVGWQALRDFARDAGIVDLLPDGELVSGCLHSLAAGSSS